MEKSISKYANLTTVGAILLAVIYAPGDYDGWDFLIGIIGCGFAIKVILSSYCDDLFSGWLVGVIACISLLAVIASALTLFGANSLVEYIDPENKQTFLNAAIIIVLSYFIGKWATAKKNRRG